MGARLPVQRRIMYEHNVAASFHPLQSDKFAIQKLISCMLIHSAVCHRLPKRILHRVWSSASSFNLQYPLFSLRSSNSCLCLLPRFCFSYVPTSIFHSVIFLVGSSHARSDQASYPSFSLLYVGYSCLQCQLLSK